MPLDALTNVQLVELNDGIGAVRRRVEAVHAGVAAEIARRSRPEAGPESLAKANGYRSAAQMIAASAGTTVGDAARLVAVGEATTPRRTLTGADTPARHPHVGDALAAGTIGPVAASAIIQMLDRVAMRANPAACDDVERILAHQAAGLGLDLLGRVIARAEAYLDPDGLEPQEQERRGKRGLTMFERDGMLHLSATLDPESAAPVKAAIEATVTSEFRTEGRLGADPHGRAWASDGAAVGDPADADAPRRTLPQRQADALAIIAAHLLGCERDTPIGGATVVVRMSLADLESGRGSAIIDGLDQPVSAATARRMAASGSVIPCVLGGDSEILDWGRRRRLFTPAQKLALTERDGGCAMCGLPPGMTKVHHLRWWARDSGSTDLSNGVLLCETCHHRVHDNGWEIRILGTGVDAEVWFIPPALVDPSRTPRLGGRRRFAVAV